MLVLLFQPFYYLGAIDFVTPFPPEISTGWVHAIFVVDKENQTFKLNSDIYSVYKDNLTIHQEKIEEIIYIEDISSPEEIQLAYNMRNKQGKHIIPAPVPEVKKQFSGYFLKSLVIPGKRSRINSEDTIIRPTYSADGEDALSVGSETPS